MDFPDDTPPSAPLTLVEVLTLRVPYEDFAAALGAALRRLEAEGLRQLVSAQFFLDSGNDEVGAVLSFSDHHRVIEHMHQIAEWPEFQAFAHTVRLKDMRVFGRLGPEAEAWISAYGEPGRHFERHVAGFLRLSDSDGSGPG
jgi:hypothetical protein